jgi:succinate-semialdehyde dehydrogenase/glutarate-semialdehyde dehydrogenase
MARTTAGTRSTFATVNPCTNEVVREFPSLRGEEIDRVVERAHRASQPWRQLGAEERAGVVGRAAVLMRERYQNLARTITLEMGKLISHSRSELDLTIRILEYYAQTGPAQIADQPLEMDDEGSAIIRNDPLGSCRRADDPGRRHP